MEDIEIHEKATKIDATCRGCGYLITKGATYYTRKKNDWRKDYKFCDPGCLREYYTVRCGLCDNPIGVVGSGKRTYTRYCDEHFEV